MKRGGYGKPWRPPADGWSVPRKVYFGGLYQHLRPALNNLPRFVNNTQATLQPGQVGSPVTRPTLDGSGSGGCENHDVGAGNNLPAARGSAWAMPRMCRWPSAARCAIPGSRAAP